MKIISIVGGGFTSLILSEILSKNYKINVYEKSSDIGGILKDYTFNESLFFKGCQYLDQENIWYKNFKKNYSSNLRSIDHQYHSFVEMKKITFLSKDFAIPTFSKKYFNSNFIKKSKSTRKLESCIDQFNLYSKDLKIFFCNILKRHNLDPKKIHYKSLNSLQMGRVAFPALDNYLHSIKKKNKIIDTIIGVKRKRIFKKKLKASLPKKGFNSLLNKIKKNLDNKNINFYFNTLVIPKWKKNNLEIFSKQKKISTDYIIWTGDPTYLVKSYNNTNLDSKFVKIIQYNLDVKCNNFKDLYIQVFSEKTSITKIYLYKINKKQKISIESMFEERDFKNILKDTKRILNRFDIEILEYKNLNRRVNARFNISSIKDYKALEKFNINTLKSNLINWTWLEYSRDKKISTFLKNLKIKKLI